MGVYYRIACPDLREYIEPAEVREKRAGELKENGGGVKWFAVVRGPVAHAVMALLMPGARWADRAIKVIGDGSDDYDKLDEWKNVTEEAIEAIHDPAFRWHPEEIVSPSNLLPRGGA